MKRKEKIRFFLELLNCNYELHFWQYDKEYHLIETNWNNELFSGDFFSYVGLESLLKKRETEKKWNPVILEAGNNLLWLAGFERAEEEVQSVYYIGPIYSGRDSLLILRKNWKLIIFPFLFEHVCFGHLRGFRSFRSIHCGRKR